MSIPSVRIAIFRYCQEYRRLHRILEDAGSDGGTAMNGLNRITVDPDEMAGFPCIRHLHIPVATVVDLLNQGKSTDEILAAYPELELEDIQQAELFAGAVWDQDLHARN